jgi:hypothetical protein
MSVVQSHSLKASPLAKELSKEIKMSRISSTIDHRGLGAPA